MNNAIRIFSSAVLIASFAGCATSQPVEPPASEAERDAAVVAYMNCLIPFAKKLDDGRSDAKTIAQAMRGACSREVGTVYETMSRGENNAVKLGMWQGMSSIEESSAVQVVLATRNSK